MMTVSAFGTFDPKKLMNVSALGISGQWEMMSVSAFGACGPKKMMNVSGFGISEP